MQIAARSSCAVVEIIVQSKKRKMVAKSPTSKSTGMAPSQAKKLEIIEVDAGMNAHVIDR